MIIKPVSNPKLNQIFKLFLEQSNSTLGLNHRLLHMIFFLSSLFHCSHRRRLSCCVMPADLFSARFLKGRLEPTILYKGPTESGVGGRGGGGVGVGLAVRPTSQPGGTKGCNRRTTSHSGHTLIQCSAVQWTRGGRGTLGVCITGSWSLYSGRDGNAESVKLHESRVEGGRG